jgi:serine/threonine protein kinase
MSDCSRVLASSLNRRAHKGNLYEQIEQEQEVFERQKSFFELCIRQLVSMVQGIAILPMIANVRCVAIDIWAVGVILISIMTARFPFFQSEDDGDALIEMATVFGLREMKECASLHIKFPKAQVHFTSRPFIADSNF